MQLKKITPAKRFVLAPAREDRADEGKSSTRQERAADRVESPTSSVPEHDVRPRARKNERVESIEDVASSPPQPMYGDIMQTVEHSTLPTEEDAHAADEDELLFETPHASKRRRTSPPQHHFTPQGAPPHRFRFPQTPSAAPSHTPTTEPASTTATASRPHFLLPAPHSPSKPTIPLPEIFSPSRKAQKYTPHGLAASVQAWIVDAAHQGPAAGIVWGRERKDGVRVKIRVGDLGGREEVECWPGGTTLVVGETEPGLYNASRMEGGDDSQGVRVLLAGHGGARSTAAVKIRVGCVVGIRAPTWEIDVDGEKWTVAVDWLVLH